MSPIKSRFSWRAFTSLYVTLSFVVMVISGLVLFVAPPGRIANWTYIPILGLEKAQWQTVHTIFTFLFIIAGSVHLYFNWKPFTFNLKNKFIYGLKIRNELIASLSIFVVIFVLSATGSEPFQSVMDFGENYKQTWSAGTVKPPIVHAEQMTLAEFSQFLNIDRLDLIKELKRDGINPQPDQTIAEIAGSLNIVPDELYHKFQAFVPAKNNQASQGRGYGRKTIKMYCDETGQSPVMAIELLAKAGIEATEDSNLRQLADKYQKKPIEIVTILQGNPSKQ